MIKNPLTQIAEAARPGQGVQATAQAKAEDE